MKGSSPPFKQSANCTPADFSPSSRCDIATWNLRGMHAYTRSKNSKARGGASRIKKNLSYLLSRFDVVCLQETNLNPKEGVTGRGVLGSYFAPGAVPYYSNFESGKAGVAILVKDTFAKEHRISSVQLPAELGGYIMALRFDPKEAHSPPFFVFNVYLDSSSSAARKRQILALTSVPAPFFSFFVGDWNFTLAEEDNTRPTARPPSGAFLKAWITSLFTSL